MTLPSPDFESLSNQGTLVNIVGPGWPNDSENDDHDPLSQVPDWTNYLGNSLNLPYDIGLLILCSSFTHAR